MVPTPAEVYASPDCSTWMATVGAHAGTRGMTMVGAQAGTRGMTMVGAHAGTRAPSGSQSELDGARLRLL
jgi:hypothetical protein